MPASGSLCDAHYQACQMCSGAGVRLPHWPATCSTCTVLCCWQVSAMIVLPIGTLSALHLPPQTAGGGVISSAYAMLAGIGVLAGGGMFGRWGGRWGGGSGGRDGRGERGGYPGRTNRPLGVGSGGGDGYGGGGDSRQAEKRKADAARRQAEADTAAAELLHQLRLRLNAWAGAAGAASSRRPAFLGAAMLKRKKQSLLAGRCASWLTRCNPPQRPLHQPRLPPCLQLRRRRGWRRCRCPCWPCCWEACWRRCCACCSTTTGKRLWLGCAGFLMRMHCSKPPAIHNRIAAAAPADLLCNALV